ncbi:DUF1471 domain-containing protein [Pectobacterium polaris]|uniref:DUF1471 domain-containing protein n=1 Tax=Pectobacterium polaris TaxID=2042057 RepID=UPI001CF2E5CB|nr:DUF1471 domain-containing protein [Pectobacterium polaris]MCA6942846.1 DUF1471 domain-containing protein [Pectobacterium polaris]MCA6958091.1 DUF1471 domain-containing protein [Pectobacterium polaris]
MLRTLALVGLTFISSMSFAAELVTHEEVAKLNLVKVETISVGSRVGEDIKSPSDVRNNVFSEKADAKGGSYYEVVSVREQGQTLVATAIVYK